jgi:hypothetical protein
MVILLIVPNLTINSESANRNKSNRLFCSPYPLGEGRGEVVYRDLAICCTNILTTIPFKVEVISDNQFADYGTIGRQNTLYSIKRLTLKK